MYYMESSFKCKYLVGKYINIYKEQLLPWPKLESEYRTLTYHIAKQTDQVRVSLFSETCILVDD